jgi:hypothetical protein
MHGYFSAEKFLVLGPSTSQVIFQACAGGTMGKPDPKGFISSINPARAQSSLRKQKSVKASL